MAQVLARAEEEEGEKYIIDWWEGDDIEAGDQITCAMNEVAVLVDEENEVLTTFPAGIAVIPEFDAEDVSLAFVRLTFARIVSEGTLEDFEDAPVTVLSMVRVTDAAKIMPLLDKLDEDETLEDWLGDELLIHAAAAIEESGLEDVDAINSDTTNQPLLTDTCARANAVLEEYGVLVDTVSAIKIGDIDE
jgi:hypothetical protein